jgi:hypothetical protein
VSEQPFDPALKDLVETPPEDWLVLAGRPRARVRIIDADLSTVSRAADKVMQVEDAEPYLFYLEFQAGHDAAELPKKLNVRSALLEERHDLPVRTVVVVLRPEANSKALTGVYRRGFKGEEPYRYFRYDVVRVWKLDPEVLLQGGLGTLPLAPIAATSEEGLPDVVTRLLKRLEARAARKHASDLWQTTLTLLTLRYPEETVDMLMQHLKYFEELAGYSVKDLASYKEIVNEVRVAERSEMILQLGAERFGSPAQQVRKQIEAIGDMDRLRAMSSRLLHVNSWQELLADEPAAKPAPRARRSKKAKGP